MKYTIKNEKELLEKIDLLLNSSEASFYPKEIFLKEDPLAIDLFKLKRFIQRLSLSNTWAPEWRSRLELWCSNYGLKVNFGQKVGVKKIDKKSFIKTPSFLNFLESTLYEVRKILELKRCQKSTHLSFTKPHDVYEIFGNLKDNFDPQNDNICNEENTFFLKDDDTVLPTHSTPLVLKDKNPCVIDYFKVYRHESKDKTHLCEFTQVEFRKLYRGFQPLKELIKNVITILMIFGFNSQNLEVRKTRYSYTAPSIEVYYKNNNGSMIELLGAGIFKPSILKRYGFPLEKDTYYLAAGFGAQRLYMILNNILKIKECYRIVD